MVAVVFFSVRGYLERKSIAAMRIILVSKRSVSKKYWKSSGKFNFFQRRIYCISAVGRHDLFGHSAVERHDLFGHSAVERNFTLNLKTPILVSASFSSMRAHNLKIQKNIFIFLCYNWNIFVKKYILYEDVTEQIVINPAFFKDCTHWIISSLVTMLNKC